MTLEVGEIDRIRISLELSPPAALLSQGFGGESDAML